MYTLHICPDDEVLHIAKATKAEAKDAARSYYPNACFLDITADSCAVYKKFKCDCSKMIHVGNIWFD